jgi:hypothetical protein
MAPKLLVPFADYSRIFRVIYSVLDGRAHTHRACVFWANTGAKMLKDHYKLPAVPIAGAAVYYLSDAEALAATFGEFKDGDLVSTPEAFHCWVECGDYALDFMAPVFHENMRSSGYASTIPRRMFQRKLSHMADSAAGLTHEGAFHLRPSVEQTESMLRSFGSKFAPSDLANICSYWYRRPPKPIPKTLDMQDDLGNVTKLELHGPEIVGVWG